MPTMLQVEKLSTASFCRRRLAVVMVRLKMAQTLREAITFIEQVLPCLSERLEHDVLMATACLAIRNLTAKTRACDGFRAKWCTISTYTIQCICRGMCASGRKQ